MSAIKNSPGFIHYSLLMWASVVGFSHSSCSKQTSANKSSTHTTCSAAETAKDRLLNTEEHCAHHRVISPPNKVKPERIVDLNFLFAGQPKKNSCAPLWTPLTVADTFCSFSLLSTNIYPYEKCLVTSKSL